MTHLYLSQTTHKPAVRSPGTGTPPREGHGKSDWLATLAKAEEQGIKTSSDAADPEGAMARGRERSRIAGESVEPVLQVTGDCCEDASLFGSTEEREGQASHDASDGVDFDSVDLQLPQTANPPAENMQPDGMEPPAEDGSSPGDSEPLPTVNTDLAVQDKSTSGLTTSELDQSAKNGAIMTVPSPVRSEKSAENTNMSQQETPRHSAVEGATDVVKTGSPMNGGPGEANFTRRVTIAEAAEGVSDLAPLTPRHPQDFSTKSIDRFKIDHLSGRQVGVGNEAGSGETQRNSLSTAQSQNKATSALLHKSCEGFIS